GPSRCLRSASLLGLRARVDKIVYRVYRDPPVVAHPPTASAAREVSPEWVFAGDLCDAGSVVSPVSGHVLCGSQAGVSVPPPGFSADIRVAAGRTRSHGRSCSGRTLRAHGAVPISWSGLGTVPRQSMRFPQPAGRKESVAQSPRLPASNG